MTRGHSKRRPAFHNDQFHIRRRDLLQALGYKAEFGDHRIPPGETGEWKMVKVTSGYKRDQMVLLPRVVLKPHGTANRLRAECPQCGKEMRFCGLQQHVGSKTCIKEQQRKEDNREATWVIMCNDRGNPYAYGALAGWKTDWSFDIVSDTLIWGPTKNKSARLSAEAHIKEAVPDGIAVELRDYEHQGKKFRYVCVPVDTDYGPENRLQLYDETGSKVYTMQEPAAADTILEWMFEDSVEYDGVTEVQVEEARKRAELVPGTPEDVCSYCDGQITDANAHYHKDGKCEAKVSADC